MSLRRFGRERAIELLFQADQSGLGIDGLAPHYWRGIKASKRAKAFAEDLAAGALAAAAYSFVAHKIRFDHGLLPFALLSGTVISHTTLRGALFWTGRVQPPAVATAFSSLYLVIASLAVLALFDFLLFDRILARKQVAIPVFLRSSSAGASSPSSRRSSFASSTASTSSRLSPRRRSSP